MLKMVFDIQNCSRLQPNEEEAVSELVWFREGAPKAPACTLNIDFLFAL
jgi:hypothetical protein